MRLKKAVGRGMAYGLKLRTKSKVIPPTALSLSELTMVVDWDCGLLSMVLMRVKP